MKNTLLTLSALLFSFSAFCQPITTYQNFHGKYDFTMIGNTMNAEANGTAAACTILTQSSAALNLQANQTVEAAYLYWSGSGSVAEGDLNIKLNGNNITAQRTFTTNVGANNDMPLFGAFADVSGIVINSGNITYTVSDFDINAIIAPYCPTGINYAGWSIVIVYKDLSLPNNIVTIYDGFQGVTTQNPEISITLSGLNVINPNGAKIGFLAWEGDANISVTEELRINNNLVGNPPLNPTNNAFNCTNSFTGAANLWNMDLDYYNIANYVAIGDTSLNFKIKTGQDTVIANCFALSLNSELADAAVTADKVNLACGSDQIEVDYTIKNNNEFIDLPTNIAVSFYGDNTLITTIHTQVPIPSNTFVTNSITLTKPASLPDNFVLKIAIDDIGNGTGAVAETSEENNTALYDINMMIDPIVTKPNDVIQCDDNEDGLEIFNLTALENQISPSASLNNFYYYNSENDATNQLNSIASPSNHTIPVETKNTIWVRIENKESGCFKITSFNITAQRKALSKVAEPIKLCNDKNNPIWTNLTSIELYLSKYYEHYKDVVLQYYSTINDAENEVNPIYNTTSFQPERYPTSIFVRAKGPNELWCDKIIEVQLNDCVVPKGISPNADGLNDVLNLSNFNLIDLKIYNRYGKIVYTHGAGYIDQWNGQDKQGNELPSGTYYYSITTLYENYVGYIYIIKEVK